MTKEEINQLGHAFFDGKTLQSWNMGKWCDWGLSYCPDLDTRLQWRIKPLEPKTITICTLLHTDGLCCKATKDSLNYRSYIASGYWTHIKSLDQVVEVE